MNKVHLEWEELLVIKEDKVNLERKDHLDRKDVLVYLDLLVDPVERVKGERVAYLELLELMGHRVEEDCQAQLVQSDHLVKMEIKGMQGLQERREVEDQKENR